jgi:hypothetical protein
MNLKKSALRLGTLACQPRVVVKKLEMRFLKGMKRQKWKTGRVLHIITPFVATVLRVADF